MADYLSDPPHDDRDPVEAELESFRPAPMSADLARRIGGELQDDSGPRFRVNRRMLFGALVTAACIALVVRWWPDRDPGGTRPGPIVLTQPSDPELVATTPALPPPSIAAYRRALAKSPDALDSLLDAHALRVLRAPGGREKAGSLHSSRTQLATPNGDTL